MDLNRLLAAIVLGPILLFSWLWLAVVEPNGRGPVEYAIIGYLIGTLFGQATLASTWTALGPAPLLWRLPLSLTWIGALSVAFMVNIAQHGGPDGFIALVIAVCLLAQWVIVQVPLWGLAIGYGLRLRHVGDPPETPRDRQFGIRQVMILTFIVAVVLGVCRMIAVQSARHFADTNMHEAWIFAFLAGAGIVMTLPLLFAALLPRWSSVAVPGVLVLIALGTWYELPLTMILPARGGGPDFWHLAWINAFQAAWVLGVVGVVRLCGYGLGTGASA
jgi:hypothetical protein